MNNKYTVKPQTHLCTPGLKRQRHVHISTSVQLCAITNFIVKYKIYSIVLYANFYCYYFILTKYIISCFIFRNLKVLDIIKYELVNLHIK